MMQHHLLGWTGGVPSWKPKPKTKRTQEDLAWGGTLFLCVQYYVIRPFVPLLFCFFCFLLRVVSCNKASQQRVIWDLMGKLTTHYFCGLKSRQKGLQQLLVDRAYGIPYFSLLTLEVGKSFRSFLFQTFLLIFRLSAFKKAYPTLI